MARGPESLDGRSHHDRRSCRWPLIAAAYCSATQQVAPGDYTFGTTQFEIIGLFRPTGTTLTVTWSAATSGFVIADAIELVSVLNPGPEIQITGSANVATGSTFAMGNASQGGTLTKTFTVSNQGQSPLTLSNLQIPSGFSMGTISPSNLFTGASIAAGGTATFEVSVVTTTTGTKTGTLRFSTNDTDENPFAINLTATVASSVQIIDNDGPTSPAPLTGTYSDSGNLLGWTGQGYLNDVREAVSGGVVETATYTFTGLENGAIYRVATTWTPFGNRTTAAPYSIHFGGGSPTVVTVNQRLAPTGFSDQGVSWQTLGNVTLSGTTLVVTLSGVDTGNVIADAVRIEKVFGPEIGVSLNGTPSTSLIDGTSSVDFGKAITGATVRRSFTIRNEGASALTIAPVLQLPAGFRLVTAAIDPANAPNPSTLFDNSTLTSVGVGGTATFTVEVDSTVPGSYSGTLSFNNNDADESPFNFLLTAQVQASAIIDDDDLGFASTPSFTRYANQGFNGDVRAKDRPSGAPTDQASWTFTGLPAGAYRVSATWSPYFNRATNAPYTITSSSGGGTAGPVLVNQRLATNNASAVPGVGTSVTASGGTFADLVTTYNHTGGDLVVTLTDSGINGWIVADAVRVEFLPTQVLPSGVAPLVESMVSSPALEMSAAAPVNELTMLDALPVVEAAVAYWSSIDSRAAERLSNVQVIIADLPSTILGLASMTTPTIWLDLNAGGRGWWLPVDVAPIDSRVDLLSVVAHELGHVQGLEDLNPVQHADALMSSTLPEGVRRVPDRNSWEASLDELFATWDAADEAE